MLKRKRDDDEERKTQLKQALNSVPDRDVQRLILSYIQQPHGQRHWIQNFPDYPVGSGMTANAFFTLCEDIENGRWWWHLWRFAADTGAKALLCTSDDSGTAIALTVGSDYVAAVLETDIVVLRVDAVDTLDDDADYDGPEAWLTSDSEFESQFANAVFVNNQLWFTEFTNQDKNKLWTTSPPFRMAQECPLRGTPDHMAAFDMRTLVVTLETRAEFALVEPGAADDWQVSYFQSAGIVEVLAVGGFKPALAVVCKPRNRRLRHSLIEIWTRDESGGLQRKHRIQGNNRVLRIWLLDADTFVCEGRNGTGCASWNTVTKWTSIADFRCKVARDGRAYGVDDLLALRILDFHDPVSPGVPVDVLPRSFPTAPGVPATSTLLKEQRYIKMHCNGASIVRYDLYDVEWMD